MENGVVTVLYFLQKKKSNPRVTRDFWDTLFIIRRQAD